MKYDLKAISRQFEMPGEFVSACPYGKGHINDTFAVTLSQGGAARRHIVQRVNHYVFKNPVALMDNVRRVTAHQRRKLEQAGKADADRHALTLVPARDRKAYHIDADGNLWRTYLFIENANTHDVVSDPRQIRQAAAAFGEFQKQLVDLPGGRLFETIPDFHNTVKRFEALEKAIEADACNRAGAIRAEIDFALARKPITGVLLEKHRQGLIPERITHNDSKLNNVLLDADTDEGICVIDLDTVMPGLALYDFGDIVRSGTNSAVEDERDLSKVRSQRPIFEALVDGYLEAAGGFLNKTEKELLVFAGKLITFEIGIRFLTDYLSGDVYFKTHRPGQNLDRCRVQFALMKSIEEQEEAMNRCVAAWSLR